MAGRVVSVADRVHAYVQEPGGWCVNNSGIVVGEDAVLIVDTAATEKRALALRAAVDTLAPGPRRIVVSTHHHGDHTFGNHVFSGPHTLLVSHEAGPAELVRKGTALQSMWPQVYWSAHPLDQQVPANYAVLLPWWAEAVKESRTRLYIGEALYKAGDPAQPAEWQDPAELSRHLTLATEYPEVRGNVFFSAKEVTEDKIGAMAQVVADHYQQPARAPR